MEEETTIKYRQMYTENNLMKMTKRDAIQMSHFIIQCIKIHVQYYFFVT